MTLAEINYDDDVPVIHIQVAWNQKELIKSIPGARSVGGTTWKLPLSWAACLQLRGTFGSELEIGTELRTWAKNARQTRIDPAWALRLATTEPEWIGQLDIPIELLDKRLYPFQRVAAEFGYLTGSGILGDQMGTGKSVESLQMLALHKLEALPLLIICPKSVKHHWVNHVNEWLPGATPYSVDGGAVTRRKLLAEATKDPTAVIIINYETARLMSRIAPYGSIALKRCIQCSPHGDPNLTPARCEVHHKELNNINFHSIIIDEAHRIKSPKSVQTRAVWALAHSPSMRWRWALTGTVIANRLDDLWSLLHAVLPDEFPTRSAYVNRYCLSMWNMYGGLDVVGVLPERREEFFAILDPHFRRMTKDIVLPQLPKKIRTTRYVDMSNAQRKAYTDVEDHFSTQLDDGQIFISTSHLVASGRLSQFALATVGIEDKPDPDDPSTWKIRLKEPSPKIDELESVLEEIGDQRVVVSADSRQMIELASARLTKLNIEHALIVGGMDEPSRQRALEFLREGRIKVLLFTCKAGGVGLDMSAASVLVNLHHPASMVDYLQTEDRVHRIGSERHSNIQVIDIITRGTIEITRLMQLREKLSKLEEINRDRALRVASGLPADDLDVQERCITNSFIDTPINTANDDARRITE